jgi:hypothetical protein
VSREELIPALHKGIDEQLAVDTESHLLTERVDTAVVEFLIMQGMKQHTFLQRRERIDILNV